MGPFEGKTGLSTNNSEVEIRPVSIDDSSWVHLKAKLRSGIKSQLLYQLRYRGSQTANRVARFAGFVKADYRISGGTGATHVIGGSLNSERWGRE
jgi:hypothetical protein